MAIGCRPFLSAQPRAPYEPNWVCSRSHRALFMPGFRSTKRTTSLRRTFILERPGEHLCQSALMSPGAWAVVKPKPMAAKNVQTAPALVTRGYVSVGIAYETEAKVEPGRTIGNFPESPPRKSSTRLLQRSKVIETP
jgi:hypothetical protein